MKKTIILALCAAQLTTATPAFAADLPGDPGARTHHLGTFAGARLRVPLGGEGDRKPRAGLAVAPLMQGRQADGTVRTRFGEGVEFGLNGGQKAELSVAGTPVSRLAQGKAGPEGRKAGVSTIGWVAIGVGVAAATVLGLYVLCGTGQICNVDDE